MHLEIDGTIIRIMQQSLKEENTACKDICMSTLIYQVTQSFYTYCLTLIDKTDPKDPTKQEDCWIHGLKTKAPLGINVEDNL